MRLLTSQMQTEEAVHGREKRVIRSKRDAKLKELREIRRTLSPALRAGNKYSASVVDFAPSGSPYLPGPDWYDIDLRVIPLLSVMGGRVSPLSG